MDVRFHHFSDKILEESLRLPAQDSFCLGGIALQEIDFGRPIENGIDLDVIPIVQPNMRKRNFAKLADTMSFTSCNHIVAWLRLLQHHVHRFNVVRSMPPCLLYTSDAADERSSVDLG